MADEAGELAIVVTEGGFNDECRHLQALPQLAKRTVGAGVFRVD